MLESVGSPADVAAIDDYLFTLERGLIAVWRWASAADVEAEGVCEIEVPRRSRRLISAGPYLAAVGPQAVWIALRSAKAVLDLAFSASTEFPSPLDVAYRPGEVVVADHLAGLVRFEAAATGMLETRGNFPEVIHPYAAAWDGAAWRVATEFGLWRCSDETQASVVTSAQSVIGLSRIDSGLLVVQPSGFVVHRAVSELTMELPGYGLAVAGDQRLLAYSTDQALYMFRENAEPLSVQLSGAPRAVAVHNGRVHVVSTEGLFALAEDGSIIDHLAGRGEPCALACAASGALIWTCGRTLRVVSPTDGGLLVREEVVLGVYPHAIGTTGRRVVIACGPGGALWGSTEPPLKLAPLAGIDYATDVATDDERVAVATVKEIILFRWRSGMAPAAVWKLSKQSDLCTCAMSGSRLVFAAGRRLSWARVASDDAVHVIGQRELPFAPRRLALIGNRVIVVGQGGALIISIPREE